MEEKKDRLTEDDINVLYGMTTILLNAAERNIQLIELAFEEEYRTLGEYKEQCRRLGRANVDMLLKRKVHDMIHNDRDKLGKILKAAKDFHYYMEILNKIGRTECVKEDVKELEAQESMIHDANLLSYIYAMIVNCNGEDDEIKILSFFKALAKGNRVSERILSRLRKNVEAATA